MQAAAYCVLSVALLLTAGCGSPPPPLACSFKLYVSPATATADHAAAPPGNQQQYSTGVIVPPGCPPPPLPFVPDAIWSVSDPAKVSINSGTARPNGLATCLAATSTPVIISGDPARGITPAELSCK